MRTVYDIIMFSPRRVVACARTQDDALWVLDYFASRSRATNVWKGAIMWREVL